MRTLVWVAALGFAALAALRLPVRRDVQGTIGTTLRDDAVDRTVLGASAPETIGRRVDADMEEDSARRSALLVLRRAKSELLHDGWSLR